MKRGKVAGNGISGHDGDGGLAVEAQLQSPAAIAIDHAGNLYIAERAGHRIRKITPRGTISTVAGNGTAGFSGDGGAATLAQLASPRGIAVDAAGNIYVSDSDNHRIRRVTPRGVVSTIVGDGNSGF